MKDKIIIRLSEEERILQSYWADVVGHIRKDLAYVWTDEFKGDFEGIKKEAGKIAFILRRLHTHYKTNKEKYNKEISDIRNLLSHLNKIQAKAEYVKQIQMDLEEVIRNVEKEKAELKDIVEPISRKYLSYEELMNITKKHGCIYHSSNIKAGEVPRIILFGEYHGFSQEKYKFVEELFELVDKAGKKLVVLYENNGGGIRNFKNIYKKRLPIPQKALYYGIDTEQHSDSLVHILDIGLATFELGLLSALVNEVNEPLIKFWKRPSSAGYVFLKSFNIDPIKIDLVSNLKEKFYQRMDVRLKKIYEDGEKRDQTMMINTLKHIRKYQDYLFFLIVGSLHIDTFRPSTYMVSYRGSDITKEADRFSIFLNQNKVSYLSILEPGDYIGLDPKNDRFSDFLTNGDSSDIRSIPYNRKLFCKIHELNENLFFKLAQEIYVINLYSRAKEK